MTAQEALTLHAKFLELKKLVEQKVPEEITLPHPWHDDMTMTYDLTGITLEDLQAHYRSYIGCGDYEYTSEHINLSTLFGA
jgi:hypothetical protein